MSSDSGLGHQPSPGSKFQNRGREGGGATLGTSTGELTADAARPLPPPAFGWTILLAQFTKQRQTDELSSAPASRTRDLRGPNFVPLPLPHSGAGPATRGTEGERGSNGRRRAGRRIAASQQRSAAAGQRPYDERHVQELVRGGGGRRAGG